MHFCSACFKHTTLLREQSKQDGKKNNVIQVSALLPLETEVIVQYSGKKSMLFESYFQNQGSMLYLSLVYLVPSGLSKKEAMVLPLHLKNIYLSEYSTALR